MSKRRHIVTIALALAIISLPYWAYVPAIVAATALIPLYGEAVLLGFLIDVLYGAHGSVRFALAALALVAAFIPMRERLRWAR